MSDEKKEGLFKSHRISTDLNELYKPGVVVEVTWEKLEKLGFDIHSPVSNEEALASNLLMNEKD